MANGSQHKTMSAISHRIACSLLLSAPTRLGDVADGRRLDLGLTCLGGHGGALRLEGGQSAGRLVALTGEPRPGPALAFDGGDATAAPAIPR
jgi:hypothetical protein